jgi:hypothetical protein
MKARLAEGRKRRQYLFRAEPLLRLAPLWQSAFGQKESSLKYQDLKIRDARRLWWLGLSEVTLLVVMLAFQSTLEPMLTTSYDRNYYLAVVVALALLAPLMWGMCIYYLLTSPKQNAAHINRMVGFGAKLPPNFDPELIDSRDPSYNVTTFTYWRSHRPKI